MIKRDYELLAGAIRRTTQVVEFTERNKVRKFAKIAVLRLVAHDLTASLEHDNPRFDRGKFLKACGVEV